MNNEQEQIEQVEPTGNELSIDEKLAKLTDDFDALKEKVDGILERLDTNSQTVQENGSNELSEAQNTKDDELSQREKALFDKQVAIELKAENLEDFAELVTATNEDELATQIAKFKQILAKMKAENSYQPTKNKNVSEYNIAKNNKNVRSMILNKL